MRTITIINHVSVASLKRGLLVCLIWALGFFSSAWAANMSQTRFDQANHLYEQGKYTEALAIYQEIEKNGSHWKLFFNCGNCYYKLGQWVNAKIYFLKARRLEPFEPAITKNIDIVNKRLNDKIATPTPDFISRLVLRIESMITLNVLSLILFLSWLIFNGFLFLLFSRGKRRWVIYGMAFSFLLLLLVASYHIYRVGKFQDRSVAVITVADSQLRSGPGGDAAVG